MIDWKDVDIDDKETIDTYYKNYSSEVSDYSFTQLLLWQKAYAIQFAELDGFLIVKLLAPGEKYPYIHMPVGTGDLDKVIEIVKDDFEHQGFILTFRSITRSQFLYLKKYLKDNLRFKLLRDQYEYVYPSHDLSRLDTKKLKRKQDMYRSFTQHHNMTVKIMNECDGEVISTLLEEWYENYPKSFVFTAERLGIEKVLQHWDTLDVLGCVIEVDGEPVSFSFGEPLTDTMFLVLIEKAIRSYKGAYVAAIKEFAMMYEESYPFTNREEDLGIPGLRKSKMLFRPSRFVEKGIVYFDQGKNMNNPGGIRIEENT